MGTSSARQVTRLEWYRQAEAGIRRSEAAWRLDQLGPSLDRLEPGSPNQRLPGRRTRLMPDDGPN
jgi:hypothetical protein